MPLRNTLQSAFNDCHLRALFLVVVTIYLSACVSAGKSPLEVRFSREHATLACFEGPTSEQSCSGTGMTVYLDGEQIRHLDWSIETSTQFIRRQYYFDGVSPSLVIETIHAKWDNYAEPLRQPRLLSTEHYRIDVAQPNALQKEFLDHAMFLTHDFKKHRQNFSRVFIRKP